MKKTLKTLSVALMLFLLLIFAVSCTGNQGPVDTGTESNEQTTEKEDLNKDPIEHVHEYGELTLILEPTCKSIGRIGRKCSCGLAVKERDLPKTDHVYNVLNVCITCGKRIVPSQGLELQSSPINGKAQFTLTGIGTCKDKNIVVPAYHNGAPVVKIASGAFGNKDIEGIYIPSTVKEIGHSAFNSCGKLKTVSIPSTLKEIGSAFNNCHNIEYSKYEGCLYVGNDTNPYLYLMKNEDENISELKIHHDTLAIAEGALSRLSMREASTIHIPANLQRIENVSWFRAIEKIYIDDLKSFFSLDTTKNEIVSNTSLFLKGELVTELEIPEGVEQINNCLLAKNTSIVSVKIPKTLTKIKGKTFIGCNELQSVVFMDTEGWVDSTGSSLDVTNPKKNAETMCLNYWDWEKRE